jgi:hypothetical protein
MFHEKEQAVNCVLGKKCLYSKHPTKHTDITYKYNARICFILNLVIQRVTTKLIIKD